MAVETIDTVTGMASYEWYLHASSGSTGDPIFPYHRALGQMQYGFQYDLDDSRIVSHSVISTSGVSQGDWSSKPEAAEWVPQIQTYKVDSRNLSNIIFSAIPISFTAEGSSSAEFMFGVGVSAMDAIHNVYYIAMPFVPELAGVGLSGPDYTTRLYGIRLGDPPSTDEAGTLILNQILEDKIVALEANSNYHTLFGLLHHTSGGEANHYYVKFGETFRNNFTLLVEFQWQFVSATSSLVNFLTFSQFEDLHYEIGATAVDHLNQKSFP